MEQDLGPQKLSFIIKEKKVAKAPAYEWQDLALRLIAELNVPNFKRNSIFKICRDNSKETVEKALNETKELAKTGDKWKYFFKVIADLNDPDKKTRSDF